MALRIKVIEDPKNPTRPRFTVEGEVPFETTGGRVLEALMCDDGFARWVPWSLVKRFPASVRRSFVEDCAWRSKLTDDDYLDILLTQPPSVVKELIECFKFTGNGGEMLKKGARLVRGLDGEQVIRIFDKNDFAVRLYLCQHCAMDVVPLLLPTMDRYTGDTSFKDALTERLAK